ncbi:MAG: hypothetical protein OXH06_08890 [Gemmatimonadetes bacterium]|nr:hypothetical protein [Gemmatimonadota bacterium]
MEELAIDGGKKVRARPFPARAPFGQREEELLLDAVRSQNLFGKSGRYVKEFAASFSDFYGVRSRKVPPVGLRRFTCGVTDREYHYGPDTTPQAVAGLRTVAVRGIHEHMEESDIRDIGTAINKGAA